MIQDLVKRTHSRALLQLTSLILGEDPRLTNIAVINLDKEGVYPYEVCLQVHPAERGWFPYMISDICCIHSLMFSVRAFVDTASQGSQVSRQAAFHYAQTLQLLQARLNAFEQGQRDLVFRDSTIMVIIFLAAAAELTGDFTSGENHVDGLLKIVSLRGGVGSLNTHNNMQVKVCRYGSDVLTSSIRVKLHRFGTELSISDRKSRADLGLALRLGTRARLFREEIAWDCFIANRGVIRCSHEPYQAQIDAFGDVLDPKLGNCWKDLHAFSCMSNLAYQTTRKLSPITYSEMMISILYRLVHLSFEEGSLQEAVRIGLLTFSSTIFLTRVYMKQPYEHLFSLFRSALFKLCQSTSIVVPQPVMLWLMILYHVVAYEQPSPGDWQSVWLGKAVSLTEVNLWPQARIILKSIMWVDFVHDVPGKKIFEAAVESLTFSALHSDKACFSWSAGDASERQRK